MKYFDWNDEKNELLKQVRKISFEEVVLAIENGNLVDRLKHPNSSRYPDQMIFYVNINGYIYAVPFVEDNEKMFLKTIMPDRKATKKYLGGNND